MNPEEQVDAISEFVGGLEKVATGLWFYKASVDPVQRKFDPLNDLNAASQAEEHLKGDQWAQYFDWIQKNGRATGVRATASERVEGILRVIGKWT